MALTLETMKLITLADVPEIHPGDSLAAVLLTALEHNRVKLVDGDIVALCQKIVSKAENRFVALDTVVPSPRAVELAQECNKDPRFVEVVLRQSSQVVRWA